VCYCNKFGLMFLLFRRRLKPDIFHYLKKMRWLWMKREQERFKNSNTCAGHAGWVQSDSRTPRTHFVMIVLVDFLRSSLPSKNSRADNTCGPYIHLCGRFSQRKRKIMHHLQRRRTLHYITLHSKAIYSLLHHLVIIINHNMSTMEVVISASQHG
jgi:hypothetical protein